MELYEGSLADKLDAAGSALSLETALGYGKRGTRAAQPFWAAIGDNLKFIGLTHNFPVDPAV